MSPLYESKICELQSWYAERLPALGEIRMSKEDYQLGVDKVPAAQRELSSKAFKEFLEAGYELSYRQDCLAFFGAARAAGLLVVE